MKELEDVAIDKRVKCVRNGEEDPSAPKRPPRRSNQPLDSVVPPSRSSSSSSKYEVSEEGEVNDQDDDEQVDNRAHSMPKGQKEESRQYLGTRHMPTPSNPSTSIRRGKRTISESIPDRLQFKRTPHPQQSSNGGDEENASEGGRPSKKQRLNVIATQEPIVEAHQPTPIDEWGINVDRVP